MAFWFHVVEDVSDFAVRADDKGHTSYALYLLTVHVLFFYDAESVADFLVDVRKQRVGQVVLGLKLLLCFWLVCRDSQDDGPGIL